MSVSSNVQGLLTILYDLRRKKGNVDEFDDAIARLQNRIENIDSDPELVKLSEDNSQTFFNKFTGANTDAVFKKLIKFSTVNTFLLIPIAIAVIVLLIADPGSNPHFLHPLWVLPLFLCFAAACVLFYPLDGLHISQYSSYRILWILCLWIAPLPGLVLSCIVLWEMHPLLAALPVLMLLSILIPLVIICLLSSPREVTPREKILLERAREADEINKKENDRRKEILTKKLQEEIRVLEQKRAALWESVESNGYVDPQDLDSLNKIIRLLERGKAESIPEALKLLRS